MSDLSNFLLAGKNRSHIDGMDPRLAERLAALLGAAPGQATIYSGYRDPKHQQMLFERAVAKYGSPQAARKWVAPPGKSQHNAGSAADLRFASPQVREFVHQNAAKYGLAFPLGHEPWHVELAGARDGNAAEYAPSGAGALPPDHPLAIRKPSEPLQATDLLMELQNPAPTRRDPTEMSLDNDQMSGTDLLLDLQRSPSGLTVSPRAESATPVGPDMDFVPKIDPQAVEFAPPRRPVTPTPPFSAAAAAPAPATPDIWSPPVIDPQLSRGDPSDNPPFPPQPQPNMARMANVPQPAAKPSPESIVPTTPPALTPDRKDDPLLEALLSRRPGGGGGAPVGEKPRPDMDLGDQGSILDGVAPLQMAQVAPPDAPGSDLTSLGAVLARILQEALAPQISLQQRQAAGLV
jgi:hypothetical protein